MNPMTTIIPLNIARANVRTGEPAAQGVPVLAGPIERIAVFRALMLSELLCALPALRALRQGFPLAEITLVGLPWARSLVPRLSCIDHFIELPGYPGLSDVPCDVSALPDFLARVQAQHFDLALQMHGSGGIVNPLVASFGARRMAGFHDDRAWHPEEDAELFVRWPEQGHEIERLLALTDALGLPRRGMELEFPVRDEDRIELARLWPGVRQGKPYVCVHPGAQLPSRRWPIERFAAVADRLIEDGRTVVLTGGVPESELVNAVADCMTHEPVNLAGCTTLWTLGALIEGAERVLCNDTGVSHIAAALRRPSVVVNCGGDVDRWAPLDRARHTVLWEPVPCRPCAHANCPCGHECAQAVEVEQVVHALDGPAPRRAPAAVAAAV